MKVLVVDDNDAAGKGLTEMLIERGFESRSVSSGIDAIGALASESWKPEVMVLDYLMPGLDGGDVLRAMRLLRDLHQVPVIILTAHDVPIEVQRHADLVLKKPLDLSKLVDAIRGLVLPA
jgi:DNA-binding response OmpR family regulator